jgi:hypothetical protein
MANVERVSIPPGSLIAEVPFTDYADAYRVRVDPERFPDVDAVARAFVKTSPSWIATLMRVRDSAVGLIGLKRSVDAPPSVAHDVRIGPGDFVGFFRVLSRNDREILAGEDDRHLDFRISFLYERDTEGNGASVVVTTVVKLHNAFGRAYFVPVAPVHRRIVPAMLRAVG